MNRRKMHKRQRAAERAELAELLSDICEVKSRLAGAYIQFNTVLEPELVEANVYEISALQAKYAYLLRKIKAYENKDVRSFYFSRKVDIGGFEAASHKTG
ncbi:MAG: DUF2508 family protein [Clostridiales bacterium]|nr:DUF2508 family protein [Clostridiales bacterium]